MRTSLILLIVLLSPLAVFRGGFGLVLFLLLALVGWCGGRQRIVANPYLATLPLLVSLLVYSPEVTTVYLPELEVWTKLLIVLAISSFVAGLACRVRFPLTATKKVNGFSLVILGLIPVILGVSRAGIPILSSDVNSARESFLIPVIGQFSLFLFAGHGYFVKRKRRLLAVGSFLLSLLLGIMLAAKFYLALAIVNSAVFLFKYDREAIRKRRWAFVFVPIIVLAMFQQTFSARNELRQSDYQWHQAIDMAELNSLSEHVFLPYMYLTTPWANFQENVYSEFDYSYGQRTVRPLLSILQIDFLLSYDTNLVRNSAFNTNAFCTDFYKDAGVVGLIFFSFLLGVFVSAIYRQFLLSEDVIMDSVYAHVLFATTCMFFSNHFTSLGYPFVVLLLAYGHSIISQIFGRAS